MKRNVKKYRMTGVALAAALACAVPQSAAVYAGSTDTVSEQAQAPEIAGLTYDHTMDLDYAEQFAVYYYADGYKLIDIFKGEQFLVVPEGGQVPEGLSSDFVVLQQPLDNIYLAASAVLALFDSMDGLDSIRLSGTDVSGWYIDNAVTAMENGDIVFAGKYDEPDYELLINEECDLAIESTMILHSPKVKELLEDLEIPVLIDYSSYEPHPVGRSEWIKLYGAMLNKEEAADAFFETQAQVVKDLEGFENTEKTVAFFYVSTDGTVVVREITDYIPRMIDIAGGRYIFTEPIDEEGSRTSVSMTMEEFYNQTVDADYLVYNATIDSPIGSIDELLAKSELFADYKAVQEGNVWCAWKSMYQATDAAGDMIMDLHTMLTTGDEAQMKFLRKIS